MLTRLFSNVPSASFDCCGQGSFLTALSDLISSTVNLICSDLNMHFSSLAMIMVQSPIAKKNICDCFLPKNPSKGLDMYRRDENGTCSSAIFFDNPCLEFLCLNKLRSVSIAFEESAVSGGIGDVIGKIKWNKTISDLPQCKKN